MKDALGNELRVGEEIASIHHSWLVPAIVLELMPNKNYRHQGHGERKDGKVRVEEYNIYPHTNKRKIRIVPNSRVVVLNAKRRVTMTSSAEVIHEADRIRDGWSDGNSGEDAARLREGA
jgi:hypothetical protein